VIDKENKSEIFWLLYKWLHEKLIDDYKYVIDLYQTLDVTALIIEII